MHLTLSLSSAHVKFRVWNGPKSKHFDITISLICAPQITDLKINVYAIELHQASETLIRFAYCWFSRYVIAAMLVDGKQKIAH